MKTRRRYGGASYQGALGPDPAEDGGGFRADDGFGRRQTKVAAVEGLEYASPVG